MDNWTSVSNWTSRGNLFTFLQTLKNKNPYFFSSSHFLRMKFIFITILFFFASTITVESLFFGGFGVGLLLGSALRGRGRSRFRSRSRFGRSIEDLDQDSLDMLIQADLKDVDDCAKMLVCHVNTKSNDNLAEMEYESLIQNTFGLDQNGELDVLKPSARFDLAAVAGQKGGLKQCEIFYGRCQLSYTDLLKIMEENVPTYNDFPMGNGL